MTRFTTYYVNGGGADHVIVVDAGDYGDGTGTSLVVDRDVIRDFQAEQPDWENWHGEDLDFIGTPPTQLTYEDIEEAFGGDVIAVRFDTEPVSVYNAEKWQSRLDFYNR